MKNSTINKLQKLNKDFYKVTSKDFDDSRQYYWKGWEQVIDLLNSRSTLVNNILDLGCGNGRFAKFSKENIPFKIYLGIDTSSELLAYAKAQLANQQIKFQKQDILKDFPKGKYDLIVSFGVLHHIPGYSNRLNFFKKINQALSASGIAVITAWRFLDNPRLKNKISSWNTTNIDPKELEENDYLLDWKRGASALRYCHYLTKEEEARLITESNLKLLSSFFADGKDSQTNKYLILSK